MPSRAELLTVETLRMLELPNVMGIGYGYKEVRGVSTGEPALTVMVRKKVQAAAMTPGQLVPRQLRHMTTDVIEVGEVVTLANRQQRVRPAPGGVSIGHERVSAGTLGTLVYDRDDGRRLILSNNHVLANSTDGQDGRAQLGDAILQPGRYDGGSADDALATLDRYVPLYRLSSRPSCAIASRLEKAVNRLVQRFWSSYELRIIKHSTQHNLVDAAVARPLDDAAVIPEILDIGIPQQPREAALGMWVQKSGRTSGWTEGHVKVIDALMRVAVGDTGFAMFADQIVTTPLGQPGDSGSLVLTEERHPVGLLAAGSQQVTICSRIQPVLSLLHIALTSGEA